MIKLLTTASNEWNYYVDKLPSYCNDIYFRSEYYKSLEVNGDGIGNLYVFQDENNIALYPFLINKIKNYNLKKTYYDIETAYGYGGPISNCNYRCFLDKFESSFLTFCNEKNIIAEFIRFHPLLDNHRLFIKNINIEKNRITNYINLDKPLEEIWYKDISSKNRNCIRKAKKSGLIVDFSLNIEGFKKIYKTTMDNVKAKDFYYFSDEYFKNLSNLNYICVYVKYKEYNIASAIFLQGKEFFHYHLAGSLPEYLKYSPNNLLLWEAINYSKINNFKRFHFGGGITDNINDSLYKFKKSFCSESSNFYIGKRIHDSEIYNYLITTWEKNNEEKSKLFLQYKL